ISPKIPELLAAEAKRQPLAQIIPAWTMGCWILKSEVILFDIYCLISLKVFVASSDWHLKRYIPDFKALIFMVSVEVETVLLRTNFPVISKINTSEDKKVVGNWRCNSSCTGLGYILMVSKSMSCT